MPLPARAGESGESVPVGGGAGVASVPRCRDDACAGEGADFLEVDVCWVTFEFNGLTCGNGGHVLQGVRDERFHEQWDH